MALESNQIQMASIDSKNMFFGKLYMGSQFVETDVIYDTMAPMITLNLKRCEGATLPSLYDFNMTDTERAVYYKTFDGEQEVQ